MSSTNNNLYSRQDLSSQSNPSEVMCIHVDLNWTLDFDKQVIGGSVTHTMKIVKEGTAHAKFDSSGCLISKVLVKGEEVEFVTAKTTKALGSCISVAIPSQCRASRSEFDVTFVYETGKGASAVQWLAREATTSGKFPFVFTQCQAIHARSLMPCQDSPGVKAPYTASVTAPVSN